MKKVLVIVLFLFLALPADAAFISDVYRSSPAPSAAPFDSTIIIFQPAIRAWRDFKQFAVNTHCFVRAVFTVRFPRIKPC